MNPPADACTKVVDATSKVHGPIPALHIMTPYFIRLTVAPGLRDFSRTAVFYPNEECRLDDRRGNLQVLYKQLVVAEVLYRPGQYRETRANRGRDTTFPLRLARLGPFVRLRTTAKDRTVFVQHNVARTAAGKRPRGRCSSDTSSNHRDSDFTGCVASHHRGGNVKMTLNNLRKEKTKNWEDEIEDGDQEHNDQKTRQPEGGLRASDETAARSHCLLFGSVA